MPHRERHQQAHRGRTRERDEDEVDQVRLNGVARLVPHVLQVQAAAVGDLRHGPAVHGPEVHVEPDGQLDRILEPHAPVHERHVKIQRTRVPGVDRELHLPDREVLRLAVRVERDVRRADRGPDHGCHGQRVAGKADQPPEVRPRQSSSLQCTRWCHDPPLRG
jgi:hypothetical protein